LDLRIIKLDKSRITD
jgi:Ran GTPase-activating protein (RanGAP) involved in mRNA processing and transport